MPPLSRMPGAVAFFLLLLSIYLQFLRNLCRWMPTGWMPGTVAPLAPPSACHFLAIWVIFLYIIITEWTLCHLKLVVTTSEIEEERRLDSFWTIHVLADITKQTRLHYDVLTFDCMHLRIPWLELSLALRPCWSSWQEKLLSEHFIGIDKRIKFMDFYILEPKVLSSRLLTGEQP